MTQPAIERRIFIVGVPRSGTTLVQSLLAAHSAVTSFTESHLFRKHFSRVPLLSLPILTRDPRSRLSEFLAENGEGPPPAADWFSKRERWTLRIRPLLPLQTLPVARQLVRVLDELALRRGVYELDREDAVASSLHPAARKREPRGAPAFHPRHPKRAGGRSLSSQGFPEVGAIVRSRGVCRAVERRSRPFPGSNQFPE